MLQSCVLPLVSTNLIKGSFLFGSSNLYTRRLLPAAKSVFLTSRSRRVFMVRNISSRWSYSVNQIHPPEFPGGNSPEELPSRPSNKQEWVPPEVPEIPQTPEIDPTESPPEITILPGDPPLGPQPIPGPEIPVPPSPSPPRPDIPVIPIPPPATPPGVVPPRPMPDWEPPRPPDILPPPGVPPDNLPPGIDPPKGPFVT